MKENPGQEEIAGRGERPAKALPDLPRGTVTLLFTDMEGSTRLLRQLGDGYATVLAQCRRLLRTAFQTYDGCEVDTQGDAFLVAFARAIDAVSAAALAQRMLFTHSWPEGGVVRVRIGLHTGEPSLVSEGYVGLDVHHAARIMSAGHGGQVLLSEVTRNLVEHKLPDGVSLRDLGEHSLKDIAQPSHLFQLVIAALPADFPPLKSLNSRFNNLPTLLTSLVGREQEIATICARLQRPEVRLVTLLGPGGIGKTHLSLQVATEMEADFAHGVCFVPLASARDPGQLFPAIAQALRLEPAEDRSPLAQLQAYLQDKHILLLLDNFEQLLLAAPKLVDLLAHCPRLRLLVTSQAALHISGEYEFTVPPLAVPDLTHLPEDENLAQVATVTLFLQRAQAVQPGFQLTKANARTIAEICTRLDGLPLAIELAAARIKLLPPPMLLKRLTHRLGVLTGGMRNLPTRHQTLRNTIQWSYELLSSEEQRLFRWLSVFVGGCTLEAVDAVYNTKAGQVMDVLEGVASLLDKSLLWQTEQEGGELRLSMLETIREYGLECLVASGELGEAQQAHAAYYLTLAQGAEPHLTRAVGIRRRSRGRRNPALGARLQVTGTEEILWLKRLERESENLRAALEWSSIHGDEEMKLALRLSSGLLAFWTWSQTSEN
ncbi:MAG: adenylate/guanylate cyclase domain-containing protein [Chloroflexi bacterium]|nr:adenylate/guanylate cyclase domain-containing protein [Chloroflexota bacterium]